MFHLVEQRPRAGVLGRCSDMAYFAPMPDGPGAPAGADFDAGGHPPPALIPVDAASVLTLLESAYDAADAQDSATIDNLARLRTPLDAILGAQGAARWMRVEIVLLSSESFASVFFLFERGVAKSPNYAAICTACHCLTTRSVARVVP